MEWVVVENSAKVQALNNSHKRRLPFFFRIKSVVAPAGNVEGLMKPLLRLALMEVLSVSSSISFRLYIGP